MIGGDNKLAIILGTYEPSIRCQGTIVGKVHCPAILWNMPAGNERQLFYPDTDLRRQVSLPIIIKSCKNPLASYIPNGVLMLAIQDGGECAMRIFTARNSDFTSWYKIWEAGTAVYYACVRDGRGGILSGLGRSKGVSSIALEPILTLLGEAHNLYLAMSGSVRLTGSTSNLTIEDGGRNSSFTNTELLEDRGYLQAGKR